MKRFLRIILIAVPVLLLIGLIALSLLMGRAMKFGVEHYLPRLTDTDVRVESAHFRPITGRILLRGVEVDNPEGFSEQQAFRFGEVGLMVRLASLYSDEIHIREIRLKQPEVLYERRLRGSNINRIISNIEESTRDDSAEVERVGSDKEVRIRVDRLLIEEGRIAVGVGPGAVRLTLPRVEMTELGSEGRGMTLDEVALLVLRILGRSIGDAAGDAPGGLIDNIRGLFQRGNSD